ncbi:DUF456 domain-containing protein [Limnochorda pilosa]|uniref:DUF456 domain-containing protein n=1 Tax=Limnochorda pilosa TaxID=1555112 RepID=A0A0K2SLA4_LIMPI|nr:DUF456 family protein [Limnochorda pilosa]BAS27901.1 hypothetical protein LIP_2060 [Limnochorda pilosa]
MDLAEWIAFGVATIVMGAGVVGTVLPMLPGIPMVWLAMLVFGMVEGFQQVDGVFLTVTLVVAIAAQVAEHYARAWGARRYGAGRAGACGAVLGAVVGLFFLPLGLVLGPFLGALVAELFSGKDLPQSVRAGWGGLVGTLGSVAVNFAVALGMMLAFVARAVV